MTEIDEKVKKLREEFRIFRETDYVYLDNSATSQRPDRVIRAVSDFYAEKNANPFRGVYELSEKCTEEYESARSRAAAFIGAEHSSEIVFTRNATEALNLIAYSYGCFELSEGDEIVVSVCEHHSNFLPWVMVSERTGAKLVKLLPDDTGCITPEALRSVITGKTRLVCVTQVSNVFGKVNDIKTLAQIAHEAGALIVCDGAQSVPHMPVDVRDLDVDFLAFSGHKMLAPMGIGVLYAKRDILSSMKPFMLGGEMIESVHWDRVKFAVIPHVFEAGTVNAGGAAGLKAAMEFIDEIGFDLIMEQEKRLTRLAMDGIKNINGIHVIGDQSPEGHEGIVTFTVDGVHPHDVAQIFDSEKICVRAGHHCAQPLMDHLGIGSCTRASFAFYNTEEEVNRFLECLSGIRRKMGYNE